LNISERKKQDEFIFQVKVIPRAPCNQFTGYRGQEAVIKIKAPPEGGKANRELIAFIAKKLSIPKNNIRLLRGMASAHKSLALPFTVKGKCISLFSPVKEKK
jgi:uncharacterized protein (TIGR00251 family)